jgi:hypothetical protein
MRLGERGIERDGGFGVVHRPVAAPARRFPVAVEIADCVERLRGIGEVLRAAGAFSKGGRALIVTADIGRFRRRVGRSVRRRGKGREKDGDDAAQTHLRPMDERGRPSKDARWTQSRNRRFSPPR